MRVFGADVDVTQGGTHRQTGDGHAFNEHVGVTLHGHAVREGARVAFIRVANHILLRRGGAQDGAPFDACWKRCATAATQTRIEHLLHHGSRLHGHGVFQTDPTAVRGIVVQRQWAGDAHAGERQALLLGQVRDLIGETQAQSMCPAVQETGFKQRGHIVCADRAIGNAALWCQHFDQGFEPKQTA